VIEKPKPVGAEEIATEAYERGLKKLESRDYGEAVELLPSAAHHRPGVARYHAALGRALSANPHWAREAILSVERAIQLEPRQPAHHVLLAPLYHAPGMRLRARRAVEAALSLAPSDPHALRVAALVEQGP